MNDIHEPILKKRNDLEQFLEEQITGPGAFNKRLVFTADWDTNKFKGKALRDCRALDDRNEVIGELPAYHYSSAILFPISITAEEAAARSEDPELPNGDDGQNEDISTKADDEDFFDDQDESVSSKNQNYPNTCGLSFAIGADHSLNRDLALTVTFRQYQKIRQHDCHQRKLGLWVERYGPQTAAIIASHFSGIFETVELDGNIFVYLAPGVDINLYLYPLDYINLDRLLRETVLPLVTSIFPDKDLFRAVAKTYDGVTYDTVTLYEGTLLDEIQKIILANKSDFDTLQLLIENLEIYQQIKQYVNELKAIHRASSRRNFPTPIWESHFHDISLILPAFNDGAIQRGEIPVEGFPDLWVSYQYLKETDAVYVKLILVNKAIVELRPDEPEQLNKKDRANELAYFGVKMIVSENAERIFVPYNPPNLLVIDEEDNFNKLLYRRFKDYAEGYNTSVSWGNSAIGNDLRYVCTEFLPQQDTPSVDFRPSKVEQNKVVGLIEDEILSIRRLSTLTNRTDDVILADLSQMISAYSEWITCQWTELQYDEITQGKELLAKQLKACEQDRNRLARNIELLRGDPKGMAAFRIMNTAMFMQLHHGSMIKAAKKTDKQPFVPSESNANFYRNISLDKEYAWRSFQLAFILLNVDAFIRPQRNDHTVIDIFGTGWPERNELADLVWFPTGGGKTEAYLGIIAFAIAYRRFTHGDDRGKGTTVLMRYTLRLLTLQQFQRATLLICALETIRKDGFPIPGPLNLGVERITIGLFVGRSSLPNKWDKMREALNNISQQITEGKLITTSLPHTECPWCGGALFTNRALPNIEPVDRDHYGINDKLTIMCNTSGCTFNARRPNENKSLPLRLFDEDIYKYPPTLLFGTVDKFAALANKVATGAQGRNQDSRRLLGRGYNYSCLPPELIIQDELHLLLGPLGSAVGLFEKSVDELCSYDANGTQIRPKVITSTATTRNTDKQIFALFDRRCEMFPKQGIACDDSFFSYYKRRTDDVKVYASNRRYIGLLPVGKTQVWMQLRVASICLAHRLKFLLEHFSYNDIFHDTATFTEFKKAFDYYHTVLSYFNSLKEVGKTQSQLSHYLPGDLNLIIKNVIPWSVLNRIVKPRSEINDSELTGRLSGEEVKSNLASIESAWELAKMPYPPELVIATNMISVGIDVSRFNTMVINSMPRNTAEYIQASSRVARDLEGIVFTVHHPFRSRDISHYQRFREFHEKFYSYVEPISVTPFANKALDRYFAMYLAVMVRHDEQLGLMNNDDARSVDMVRVQTIRQDIKRYIYEIYKRSLKLNVYLKTRPTGVSSNVEGIITEEEIEDIDFQLDDLLITRWLDRITGQDPTIDIKFRESVSPQSLFAPRNNEAINDNWNVKESLREIAPAVVIKTVQQ
ncbi:helicase-related protein [Mucilaginibacter sp.]|jgi:hypothetical protein|uniref:helicase-related protein n=1 Tax=Mucilaginibacter sp. TaxID=1882438 RepID=UPI002CBAC25A|nr:helicase-related protein [Mucilaginibacter sp.]HTI58982.1 helicase-related protein [Mucilaginibacter sp.]